MYISEASGLRLIPQFRYVSGSCQDACLLAEETIKKWRTHRTTEAINKKNKAKPNNASAYRAQLFLFLS
jgi:hypothetical protein